MKTGFKFLAIQGIVSLIRVIFYPFHYITFDSVEMQSLLYSWLSPARKRKVVVLVHYSAPM